MIWGGFLYGYTESYQFWQLLSQELEFTECETDLSDFVNHVGTEKKTQFDPSKVPDSNLKLLNVEKLENLGLTLIGIRTKTPET